MMDDTLLRIVELMKEQRISDVEMQNYLAIPKGTFSNRRRCRGKSYYQYIDKIADRLGVSIDYLVRGRKDAAFDLTEAEEELISNYRKLRDEAKRIVSESARLLPRTEAYVM